jgi:hypothetical protein
MMWEQSIQEPGVPMHWHSVVRLAMTLLETEVPEEQGHS